MSISNKVILIGNVGKEPEARTMPDGTTVVSLSLATTERYKDRNGEKREKTEWHNIVFWGATAETIKKYATKGMKLAIEGSLHYRDVEDKETGKMRRYTDINAETFQFLSPKEDAPKQQSEPWSSRPMRNQPPLNTPRRPAPAPAPEDDPDLPF